MTTAELTMQLHGRADYISRHRPMLMHVQVFMFTMGVIFFISGITFDSVYSVATWGSLLYDQSAWFWGAFGAIASAVCVIGLIHPPRSKVLVVGGFLHILQFSAISMSCLFYGGDFAIGVWALGFLGFHAKMFSEAVRSY